MDSKTKHEVLKGKYSEIFNSDAGQMVLEHLVDKYYVDKTTYSETTNEIIIKEGNRQVILHILNMIK